MPFCLTKAFQRAKRRFFAHFQINTHMNIIQSIVNQPLAQAAAAAPEQASPWTSLIMMVLMLAAFYFLLIAPQRKAQKQREKVQNSLAVGDEILTGTGIYGRVVGIKDDRITIALDDGRMTIHKSVVEKKAESADKPASLN